MGNGVGVGGKSPNGSRVAYPPIPNQYCVQTQASDVSKTPRQLLHSCHEAILVHAENQATR